MRGNQKTILVESRRPGKAKVNKCIDQPCEKLSSIPHKDGKEKDEVAISRNSMYEIQYHDLGTQRLNKVYHMYFYFVLE